MADYEEPVDPATKSFFSEIISSISDVKFSHDGRYFLTRDYLTVKVRTVGRKRQKTETKTKTKTKTKTERDRERE